MDVYTVKTRHNFKITGGEQFMFIDKDGDEFKGYTNHLTGEYYYRPFIGEIPIKLDLNIIVKFRHIQRNTKSKR